MICVTLTNYLRACSNVSGGISDVAVFDPDDLDFTQAAIIGGVLTPYTAVALRTGATGNVAFLINFQSDEGEWTVKQSVKGCSVKYEFEFHFQLPQNSLALTNFLAALDAASCCCGLGLFIRMNDGTIFVAGEKYVNTTANPRFNIKHDGSDGGSGKLIDDFNGVNLVLKGSFSRNLVTYTGGWDDIEGLMGT